MNARLAVRIPIGNKLLFFRSGPYVVSAGDHVLVQVEGDLQMGRVERAEPAPEDAVAGPSPGPETEAPGIFRPATPDDLARDRENKALAQKAFEQCRRHIQECGLEMKLVDVAVLFDGSKILFFFTAPSRIDFRELVKDLVRAFRTRIELRQISARHETQMVGGIGNCGQLVCCQRFLRQFAPSTIKMAKEQNLFLNPAKISGVCNRLLCCLSYEQLNYEEFLSQCPKVGKKFATAQGPAKVLRANYFRRSLNVYFESGGEREVDLEEWFKLAAPGRPAQSAKPQEASADAPAQAPPAPAGQAKAQGPQADKPALEAEAAAQSGRIEPAGQQVSQRKHQEAPQGQARKDGRSKSRKSKRRSRSSRSKSRSGAPSRGGQGKQAAGRGDQSGES